MVEQKQLVTRNGDWIIINTPVGLYKVPANQADNYLGIVECVLRISRNHWATARMIHDFVDVALGDRWGGMSRAIRLVEEK